MKAHNVIPFPRKRVASAAVARKVTKAKRVNPWLAVKAKIEQAWPHYTPEQRDAALRLLHEHGVAGLGAVTPPLTPAERAALRRAQQAAQQEAMAARRAQQDAQRAAAAAAAAARRAGVQPVTAPSGAPVVVRPAVNRQTGQVVNVAVDSGTGKPIAAAPVSTKVAPGLAKKDDGALPPGIEKKVEEYGSSYSLPPGIAMQYGGGGFYPDGGMSLGDDWNESRRGRGDDSDIATDEDMKRAGLSVKKAIDKKTGETVKVAVDPKTGQPVAVASAEPKKSAMPAVATIAAFWWLFL